MNDYKELVKELKRNGLSNGSRLGHHSGLCDEAADAIEQLVKERDAAIGDLKDLAYCTKCLHENKYPIKNPCCCCKGDMWEWRGVQEDRVNG